MRKTEKVKENVTMSLTEWLDQVGEPFKSASRWGRRAEISNKYKDEKLTYDEWFELFWQALNRIRKLKKLSYFEIILKLLTIV